ncbi:hypothetical protein V8E53_004065 [Lactarius tabidus]
MDSKDPQEDRNLEECFLATFGTLGRGGAHNLCRFTQNKILTLLGLHDVDVSPVPSIQVIEKPHGFLTINKWRQDVKKVTIKEEDTVEVEEEGEEVEADKIEEVSGGTKAAVDEVEVVSSEV